ncbi:MAG: oxaloacetate decarboxylase, partial [Proteiniphilum sp.]|nr:oxaloacetate decarboxylase [Proteiniphilum sp.]
PAVAVSNGNNFQPKTLVVNVDNEEFVVNISYPDAGNGAAQTAETAVSAQQTAAPATAPASSARVKEVISPLEGKFFLTKDSSETALKVGDSVKSGDLVGYIESMKTYNAITAEESGKVVEICFANGDSVDEDDILIKIQ